LTGIAQRVDELQPMHEGNEGLRITISGATSFLVAPGESVLAAALRSGLGFPYECSAGGCGSCKFQLVSGDLECPRPDAPGLRGREWEKGKRLACQCSPVTDCEIKVNLQDQYVPVFAPSAFDAEIVEVLKLTHDLWEFRLKSPAPAQFLPGQYALVTLPRAGSTRVYSMCNLANPEGRWHFQIKRVPNGVLTSALFDTCQVGDKLRLDGPYGTACLKPSAQRDIICIAGGSGLAPMVSVANGAAIAPSLSDQAVHLFYGGRQPRDIVDPATVGLHSRIQFVPVVSDTAEPVTTWTGATGFVHETVEKFIGAEADRFEYYLAGPPPMVEAARRLLILGKSVPVDQIHYDRFF
jgi:toluene monooxygenase electron transfer component